jgi:carboxyl-terminal processing protease
MDLARHTLTPFRRAATLPRCIPDLAAGKGLAAVLSCLAIGLLSACSGTGSGDTAYSRDRAEDMFESAYGHVEAHFIDPIGMDTIALAGLTRLSVIDGRMLVASDSSGVILLKEGEEVQRFPWPDRSDRSGWAGVTADVVERSRQVSPVSAATPPEEIYTALMEGMVSPLDQYSRYEDARKAGSQREARNGFGGLGVTIRSVDGQTTVVETLPDTPAFEAGLESGDILTHADSKPLAGLTPLDVVEILRGRIGSTVIVDVKKSATGITQRLSMERVEIVPPTVLGQMAHGVGVIRIRTFNRRTAADLEDEVERLEGLQGGKLTGLVLDLRDNPGGLLDQAVQSADLFLSSGPVISTRGRHPAANSVFAADSYQIAEGVPLAILTNGRSASASEMLAAALQDRGRAVVIGSTSHGKGSVQNLQEMPNGGELIITWSRMHAPTGYLLDGLGVLPNICTSLAQPASSQTENGASVARLRANQDRLTRQFQDWRRYDKVDLGLAGTLRRTCPPSPNAPDSDLSLAAKVLLQPAAYALALSPGLRAPRSVRAQAEFHRPS